MPMSVWTTIVGVALGACITWIIGIVQQGKLWRSLRDVIMDRHHVCLNEEFLLSQMLAASIKKAGFRPDVIFAISPGGGMIAEWLARAQLGDLEKPIRVRSICVHSERSRSGIVAERPVVVDDIHKITADLPPNSRILLVNDISRGGETLRVAHEALLTRFQADSIQMATLICQSHSRTKPHFFSIRTDKMVQFDWKESQNM